MIGYGRQMESGFRSDKNSGDCYNSADQHNNDYPILCGHGLLLNFFCLTPGLIASIFQFNIIKLIIQGD
jgi:hypothetical protein